MVPAVLACALSTSIVARAESAALVLWPNCAAPGDTVYIKSGAWPDYGGPYQGLRMDVPSSTEGTYWYAPPNGRATQALFPVLIDAGAQPGSYMVQVSPITCLDPGLVNCQWIPSDSPGQFCRRANLTITSDPGNPLDASIQTAILEISVGGVILGRDTITRCVIRFDPGEICNSSPCTRIRFIQVVRPMGRRDGAPGYVPFAAQGTDTTSLAYWREIDTYSVNGWSLDHLGDSFEFDADTQAWVNRGGGERDPYYNGDDPTDSIDIAKGFLSVGSMGSTLSVAQLSDIPGGGGDSTYVRAGLTSKIKEFEVNAFCSDGANQGEWIGRVKWSWERPIGGPTTASIIAVEPREKPTPEFMAALSAFVQRKVFAFPDRATPSEGGQPCPAGGIPPSGDRDGGGHTTGHIGRTQP